MMTNTFERLIALIAEQQNIEISAITPETGLADAGLDSLAVAELLFSIEERFGVDLGDVQPEQVPATLAELVRLVDGKAAA